MLLSSPKYYYERFKRYSTYIIVIGFAHTRQNSVHESSVVQIVSSGVVTLININAGIVRVSCS